MSKPIHRWLLRAMLGVSIAFGAGAADAHKPSDAYLSFSNDGHALNLRWDLALRDLDMLLDLDADRDGRLSWGEVRARQPDIVRAAFDALTVSESDSVCRPGPATIAIDRHSDGGYVVLDFPLRCASPAERIDIGYRMFKSIDPTHRAIVRSGGRSVVVTNDGASASLEVLRAAGAQGGWPTWQSIASYIGTGMFHILVGWDHLAFLVLLLLPAVLHRSKGRWLPNEDLRASLKQVLLTITAFTLAHSITLTLATLQWVQLPPRLIESGIAISIVATAVLNVYAPAGRHIWALAFGFGLVHGFGFANALADSGLTGASMAWSLLGFNLGVEAGQLLFIGALWPPVWLLRNRDAFARVAMPMVSLSLTLLGAAWFIERAFEIRVLPG
jgi:HupE / UreJ protein